MAWELSRRQEHDVEAPEVFLQLVAACDPDAGGLFEAARSEAELASVLAHEMAHVALRHGTHQASKAYLGQAGLGILGGLLGKNGGNTSQIVNAVGGLGLNALFLKFGRDAEYQADQTGAAIMAAAPRPISSAG